MWRINGPCNDYYGIYKRERGVDMANQEHLDILKQGVECWNEWRREHENVKPDLGGIHLTGAFLSDINLCEANLSKSDLSNAFLNGAFLVGANLRDANLSNANLIGAFLNGADLSVANLTRANLRDADLIKANLREGYFTKAHLINADLSGANLNSADLSEADLSGADLTGATLQGTNLREIVLARTIFEEIDLSRVKGLTEIFHSGPSRAALHTVKLPLDGSALHFLRGIGLPDEWISFYRSSMIHPIQYHSCFISYAHRDEMLARRLHADLQDQGVRCWFAPEDMKIGDKIRTRIDEAIHLQDKLLLLLSEHALASTWVEDEVEAAIEKERRQQREVLFPIRLDESVMQTSQAWAAKLRRSRHIGDFTQWADLQAYQQAFDRLLRDLKADSKEKIG